VAVVVFDEEVPGFQIDPVPLTCTNEDRWVESQEENLGDQGETISCRLLRLHMLTLLGSGHPSIDQHVGRALPRLKPDTAPGPFGLVIVRFELPRVPAYWRLGLGMPMAGGSSFSDRVAEVVELFRAGDVSGGCAGTSRLSDDFPGSVRWPECARLLLSGDPAERAVGVALIRGPESDLPLWVEQLWVRALDDPDPDVVMQALWCASLRRTPSAVPALARVARASTPPNRSLAAGELARSPGLSYPATLSLLRDSEVRVRREAVRAVALGVEVSTDEVVSALLLAGRDPDVEVRGSALAGLAARRVEGASELIAAEIEQGQVGSWLLRAAELAADSAILPALGRLDERHPDVIARHSGEWMAAMSACEGNGWALHPQATRRDRGADEPLADEERVALEGRRSGGGGSTCVWLRDGNFGYVWLVDLASLQWQRFALRDFPPSPPSSLAPVAGQASRSSRGGMVAVYRIGSHHRMIIGRQRFDLTRPGTFSHRCRGLLSTITAVQGTHAARARRFEGSYWPEAIGFGDPMITYREPFGGWYPFDLIAGLANSSSDHTAGPYDYRHDHQELIIR
jgi:hypothetical protein